MIASIRGEVLATGVGWATVGVGGMGYRVEVPSRLSGANVGTELSLHTHLVVREDALTLFGFETVEELTVFTVLLSVSGVGPRSALGVLSELTPSQIATAVVNEDEKPFRKVSGIGPKTAKLIVVQLAGKLDPSMFQVDDHRDTDTAKGASTAIANVVIALAGLGYPDAQAEFAVQEAVDAGAPEDEAGLLRAALALLQAPRPAGRSSTINEKGAR